MLIYGVIFGYLKIIIPEPPFPPVVGRYPDPPPPPSSVGMRDALLLMVSVAEG